MTVNKNEIASFLPIVRDLAVLAGARLMELRHTALVRTHKADNSLVTNADHAANAVLRDGLRKNFSGHSLISEETGREGPSSDFVWLIDPLDGTRAYAKGRPGFCVMVGLLYKEWPVLGVVFDPLGGHLYEASCGAGCHHTFENQRRPVRVSGRNQERDMPLVTSTGFPDELRRAWKDKWDSPEVEPINSVGVKAGYLVRGAADIYINHHHVHLWDTCAPVALLEEAGGTMTFIDGKPLSYPLGGDYRHSGPTLATNNTRHEDFIAFLRTSPSFVSLPVRRG
jgi:3'-phosphoadenosine 5'-phosphosulfate (PAPS) 3'-phosphatase